MLSRFLHSFRWALQPVKHISSRRFARLSSHLLCNATVPVQFHSLVWLATDKWQQQFATIYEISALERDSFRNEAKPRRDKSWKTRSRNLFWVRIWFSLCSADCGNWCCDTLITQPMRLLRNSHKFFNKSDKSKTPPTLSQATRGVTRVEFIRNPCPKLQHLSHNTQTGSASAEQPSKKSKHP